MYTLVQRWQPSIKGKMIFFLNERSHPCIRLYNRWKKKKKKYGHILTLLAPGAIIRWHVWRPSEVIRWYAQRIVYYWSSNRSILLSRLCHIEAWHLMTTSVTTSTSSRGGILKGPTNLECVHIHISTIGSWKEDSMRKEYGSHPLPLCH